jgi:hypothetical protein
MPTLTRKSPVFYWSSSSCNCCCSSSRCNYLYCHCCCRCCSCCFCCCIRGRNSGSRSRIGGEGCHRGSRRKDGDRIGRGGDGGDFHTAHNTQCTFSQHTAQHTPKTANLLLLHTAQHTQNTAQHSVDTAHHTAHTTQRTAQCPRQHSTRVGTAVCFPQFQPQAGKHIPPPSPFAMLLCTIFCHCVLSLAIVCWVLLLCAVLCYCVLCAATMCLIVWLLCPLLCYCALCSVIAVRC